MIWFLSVLVVLTSLAFWFWRTLLPPYEGELLLEALTEPVSVRRDRFGVPLIEATSVRDAVLAQGFLHAQERLWQMEFNRHVGGGRLCELFGSKALPADRFLRRFGLVQAARGDLEALSASEIELLEAYCQGVNAGVAQRGWRLPLEFWLLRHRPAPWQPLDSLLWIQVMAMDLGCNWEMELMRSRLLQHLGPEKAARLELYHPEDTSTLPGAVPPEILEQLAALYEAASKYLPNAGLPGASNAWAVSSKRSQSGRPLLASDPHLVGRLPCIWYENGLKAPGLSVFGVSFPGLPLVVIGHNDRVAWGITNSFADVQDLVIERLDGQNRYQTEEGWLPLRTQAEEIAVRGAKTEIEEVLWSRNGPLLASSKEHGLALRSTSQTPSRPVATLLAMNRAANAHEFRAALEGWHAPSINLIFADVEDNVAYFMAGKIPIRGRGSGHTPAPGWLSDYDWKGFIPFDELPQAMNPPSGVVMNANNAAVAPDFPYHITWDWMGDGRAARLEQLLASKDKHSSDDFRRYQMDCTTLVGARFGVCCGRLLADSEGSLSTAGREALAELGSWDGELGPDSCAGAIYQVMLLRLLRLLLRPSLGDELTEEFLGGAPSPLAMLAGHAGRYTGWLVRQLEAHNDLPEVLETGSSWEELMVQALEETVEILGSRLGARVSQWRWGALHEIEFAHPLGVTGALSWFFNSPSAPIGGDVDTPLQTIVVPQDPYEAQGWSPSWRQVVDLGAPWQSTTVLPGGQSGIRQSRHYLDQFRLWCEGEQKTHQFEERLRELRLVPGKPSAALGAQPRRGVGSL